MIFRWDPLKAASNVRRHGVSFKEAASAFRDPLAWVFQDEDHSEGERRQLLIGFSDQGRLLVVSFVERDETLRIISARLATRREQRKHEEAHE